MEIKKDYYQENKNKILLKNKQKRKENLEHFRMIEKKWRDANPEKVKLKYQKWISNPKNKQRKSKMGKKWREKNQEYRKKYHKEHWKKYYENNKNEMRMKDRLRDYRERKAIGSHTLGEWELLKKQYGYCCPSCGRKEPKIKLSEDHIIPLIKGGSNWIENIQPLCLSCNSKKGRKIIKFHRNKSK